MKHNIHFDTVDDLKEPIMVVERVEINWKQLASLLCQSTYLPLQNAKVTVELPSEARTHLQGPSVPKMLDTLAA